MVNLAARALWLLALTLACGEKRKAEVVVDPPGDDAAQALVRAVVRPDAQGFEPSREGARDVVQAFAAELLAVPPGEMGEVLRIPEGPSEQQLAFFYKELRRKHVNQKGIDAVLEKDFGPLAERLGDKAQSVADQVGLSLDETWAFGDVESAVILQWDGQRFWVASVHQLLAPQ